MPIVEPEKQELWVLSDTREWERVGDVQDIVIMQRPIINSHGQDRLFEKMADYADTTVKHLLRSWNFWHAMNIAMAQICHDNTTSPTDKEFIGYVDFIFSCEWDCDMRGWFRDYDWAFRWNKIHTWYHFWNRLCCRIKKLVRKPKPFPHDDIFNLGDGTL